MLRTGTNTSEYDYSEFNPGEILEFHIIAYDEDGDTLTYTWEVDAGKLSATTGTDVGHCSLLLSPHCYYVNQTVSEGCDNNEFSQKQTTLLEEDCHEKG